MNIYTEHCDLRVKMEIKMNKNNYTQMHSQILRRISKHVQGFCVTINILYTANKENIYWAINKDNTGLMGSISTIQLQGFRKDVEPGSVCFFSILIIPKSCQEVNLSTI